MPPTDASVEQRAQAEALRSAKPNFFERLNAGDLAFPPEPEPKDKKPARHWWESLREYRRRIGEPEPVSGGVRS